MWLFLLPLGAFAMGLGRIHVQSHLAEPFQAQLELLQDTYHSPKDIDGLKLQVANSEAYQKLGLAREAYLDEFAFKITQDPKGDVIIALQSKQPIDDPIIDLVVQLSWQGGKFERDYRVLLDPAHYEQEALYIDKPLDDKNRSLQQLSLHQSFSQSRALPKVEKQEMATPSQPPAKKVVTQTADNKRAHYGQNDYDDSPGAGLSL